MSPLPWGRVLEWIHTVAYTVFSRGSVFLEDKTGSTIAGIAAGSSEAQGER